MLCEWSTMGVPEQFLHAFEKEYVVISWCVATLPAGYPTTNNAQEGMNSSVIPCSDFVQRHYSVHNDEWFCLLEVVFKHYSMGAQFCHNFMLKFCSFQMSSDGEST